MHPNFEKAFEATKKKEFINARDLYHDLLLDIKTYSDYYLLKEIIFLLDQRIERHNIEHSFQLEEYVQTLGYSYITDESLMKKIMNKKDPYSYDYLILIEKGFFHSSYIGINEQLKKMMICFYQGKIKYELLEIPLDAYFVLNFNYHLCAYFSGCTIDLISEKNVSVELTKLMNVINTLLFEYHLKEDIQLIDLDKIHQWYLMMEEATHCDLNRLESQDFGDFHFDLESEKEIVRVFKLVAPLMWLSNQNEMKVPVQDIQYDLLGNKWGNHRDLREFLAILKVLPFIQFGKSVFIHYDSYYLPYENSYYIIRSITRLPNDQNID